MYLLNEDISPMYEYKKKRETTTVNGAYKNFSL